MSLINISFIIVNLIGGISLLFLFVLYPQLSNILSKNNKDFEKKLQTVFDVILMYKTFKRINNNSDKNILKAGMIFYSIGFICVVLGIIMVFIT